MLSLLLDGSGASPQRIKSIAILTAALCSCGVAVWLSRQITEAFAWNTAPLYLLRDRDASYGSYFRNRVEAMGIKEVVTASRSPWQNARHNEPRAIARPAGQAC
jgi:hypothetical protein